MLQIHYFASIREALARERDELSLPGDVKTVGDLIRYLSDWDQAFAYVAESQTQLLIAVNQTMVARDHELTDGDEVAFFPPMTGG